MPPSEQEWWLARHRRKRVEHHCGHPHAVCSDPEREWFPQREVCYPTMEAEAARERYRVLHEKRPWHDGTFTSWAEEQSPRHPYHFNHGVTIWAAAEDLGNGGDFLGSGSAEQSDRDADQSEDAEG